MKKIALITGITGQDGSYLAELLLKKNYEVHGIKRRASSFNTSRIDHLYQDPHAKERNFFLHYGDMTDAANLISLVQKIQPDEIYNLAAQSHVQVSYEMPEYTANTDGLGTLRMLEAIRILGLEKKTRFYQASTSELFSGKPGEAPQNENTPFAPRSPYAAAKLYAYWITVIYRQAYGIFACNGVIFNHESPRRGETFVTRKITRAAARISLGLEQKLYLGNLDAKRDWGHSRDCVEAIWLTLQQSQSDDYLFATGKQCVVRDFCRMAFKEVGMDLDWQGLGLGERGIDKKTGKVIVEVDPRYFRPVEVESLLGDPSLTQKKLGWVPKTSLSEMIKEMVAADLEEAKRDVYLKGGGFCAKNYYE